MGRILSVERLLPLNRPPIASERFANALSCSGECGKEMRSNPATVIWWKPTLPIIQPRQVRQTNQPSLVAIEQSLNDNNVSGDQPQPVTAPAIEATKVFSSPVNTLELGQSLYRTKNYTAALRALEAVDVDTLSDSDRHWLGLLIALCQRRLGQTDVAEARLREIANANSTDYPIPVARWWLKQTSLLRETRPILDGISTELDTLIERSKQHVQQ